MRRVIAALLALASPCALAQGFAALVSPPRFELVAKPGDRLRDVIEITNAGAQASRYKLRTADWSMDASATVKFDDALSPGSCRPWVAIERREMQVSPGGKYRYRFEVAVPADAPVGECRFAILLEGDDQKVDAGGLAFPVSGRLGIIVYVIVGDAQPNLAIVDAKVAKVSGETLPVVMVANTGTAHGRLAGFLSGTDASGRKLEFTPSSLPILPGETRAISLGIYREKDEPMQVAYPVTISGKLEWNGKSMPFEKRFAP
jgi:hypothetical protein